MSKDEGWYQIPKSCVFCGSSDIVLKNLIMSNSCVSLQVWCNDCQGFHTLPKEENIRKRNNGMLNKWAMRVKERDNNTCVVCGSVENLQAHHIIPVSHTEKYKYTIANGITLCKKCHYLAHNKEIT